jgi:excisionase family DNA binding protein
MPRPTLDGTSASSESQRTNVIKGRELENSGLPMLLTPAEAARQLSLSRYTVYSELRAGRLRGRRYGRVILIPREELERFANALGQK